MQIEKSQGDQSGAEELEVCDLIDLIGVEGKNNPAGDPNKIIFGQMPCQEKHAVGIEKKREKKDEIVDGYRVFCQKMDRKRDKSLRKEMFRIAECVGLRIKSVCVKDVERILEQLLLNPTGNPGI